VIGRKETAKGRVRKGRFHSGTSFPTFRLDCLSIENGPPANVCILLHSYSLFFSTVTFYFDPMTLTYKPDLDILKTYLKMNFLGHGIQKLEHEHMTDRQTDASERISIAALAGGNNPD